MTMAPAPAAPAAGRRVAGYFFALGAGAVWGTTGVLSTALYAQGAAITGIGFWRVLLGVAGLALYGARRREIFAIDAKGWLVVGAGGGLLVAIFEVAYQYAIAGTGVAGAAALLYVAPVVVAVAAWAILGEALTPLRVLLALVVMVGAALAVNGGDFGAVFAGGPSHTAGIVGGLLAMLSYASTTLLARWSVPRYGSLRVLFLELLGGTVMLGILLPLFGRTPAPPAGAAAWIFLVALAAGPVLGANFLFFAGVKRIEAAPAAVTATIEPVVGALLALVLLAQKLTAPGWLGLAMVVGGVAATYWSEASSRTAAAAAAAAERG